MKKFVKRSCFSLVEEEKTTVSIPKREKGQNNFLITNKILAELYW